MGRNVDVIGLENILQTLITEAFIVAWARSGVEGRKTYMENMWGRGERERGVSYKPSKNSRESMVLRRLENERHSVRCETNVN